MILVLENGQQVDSNDTETLEKAAAMLEQEALDNAAIETLEKAAEKGELTPEKAKKILHDGEVHGKPLTDQQRKYFGAVAGGTAKKSESGAGESMASIEALEQFSKAIYIGPRGGRWLDPKHTIPWKAEGAKKPAATKEPPKKPVAKEPADEKQEVMRDVAKVFSDYRKTGVKEVTVSAIEEKVGLMDEPLVAILEEMGAKVTSVSKLHPGAAKVEIPKKEKAGKKPADFEIQKDLRKFSEIKLELSNMRIRAGGPDPKDEQSAIRQIKDLAVGLEKKAKIQLGQIKNQRSKKALELQAMVRNAKITAKKIERPTPLELKTRSAAEATEAKPETKKWKGTLTPERVQGMHEIGLKGQRETLLNRLEELETGQRGGGVAGGHRAASYEARRGQMMADVELLNKELARRKSKTATKSLSEWLDEQENDMTNETELLKALGDDAELAKGMMGYGGKRVLEWADQFYYDTGLEKQALQCVKDMIACQKKWEAHNKGGKSYREVEDMPRKAREAYRDEQSKVRGAIDKEEDAIRMKMRDLESKLVDYRIKEVSVRQSMGKSGVEALSDFAKSGDAVVDVDVEVVKNETGTSVLINYLEKAQTMPTGEPGMSRGPEDGADLARVKGPTGSVDSSAGPPIGEPGAGKKKKLSEDDDEVENQLKGRKKPIERMTGKSMAVPGHQREMVAHENAQLVSALRKGPDDITIGPGVPAPVVEPEPVHKANQWVQGEDSLVVYGDGSDAAAARLVKGEDFYAGGQAPALGRNPMVLNQGKPCRACGATMAKSLSVCPHCGDGAGLQKQGTLRIAASAVRNGPGLRPSRHAADIVIK